MVPCSQHAWARLPANWHNGCVQGGSRYKLFLDVVVDSYLSAVPAHHLVMDQVIGENHAICKGSSSYSPCRAVEWNVGSALAERMPRVPRIEGSLSLWRAWWDTVCVKRRSCMWSGNGTWSVFSWKDVCSWERILIINSKAFWQGAACASDMAGWGKESVLRVDTFTDEAGEVVLPGEEGGECWVLFCVESTVRSSYVIRLIFLYFVSRAGVFWQIPVRGKMKGGVYWWIIKASACNWKMAKHPVRQSWVCV